MSTAGSSEQSRGIREVADVVCPYCSCACDDILLRIEGDRIIEAHNACPPARMIYLGYQTGTDPACLIDGEPTSVEAGIERAAEILAGSRYPLIFGTGEATTETHRAAVSLAERIGACVDFSTVRGRGSAIPALQGVGEVTCTLGEIRNRADLILVWGADPIKSDPRLFSRYALEPAGRLVPAGRSDRYCVIVDVRETNRSREAADQFLSIRGGGEEEAIWTLRALAAGIAVDAEAVASRTGVPLETWRGLVERMKAARYGVVFYDGDDLVAHGIHSLTRALNAVTRFACIPLSPFGPNLVGARNALTWRTGYPGAVSLARGYPRYSPDEYGTGPLLRSGLVDAVLNVGSGWTHGLPPKTVSKLERIPRIVLETSDKGPPPGAAVFFRTAFFGINTTGTVYRMDGVPLPLRGVLPSPFQGAEQVLRSIEQRVIPLLAPEPVGAGGG